MYNGRKVVHIVARDLDGKIGKDDMLMWHIPEDLNFFKEQTLYMSCVVGRKTFSKLPKLRGRDVVVVGTGYNTCLTKALDDCTSSVIYIIGGESVYNQTFDIADELLVTEVLKHFDGDKEYIIPDTTDEKYDFTLMDKSAINHTKDGLGYQFSRYKKVNK